MTITPSRDREGGWGAKIPRDHFLDAVAASECSARAVRYASKLAWEWSDQNGRPAGVTKEGRRPGVSRATIAAKLGCSTKTVDRACNEVERVGVVEVERRPGHASVYHLRPREGTRAATHVEMRRQRAADAKARTAGGSHKGRVTTPAPERQAETCPACHGPNGQHRATCAGEFGRAPPTD